MSLTVTTVYQPGGLEQLKDRLLQSMQVGTTKTAACKSAHSRGYSHGFIDQAWQELYFAKLVEQNGRVWQLTEKGRNA